MFDNTPSTHPDPLTQLILILLLAFFGFSITGYIIRGLLWLIGFGAEGPIAGSLAAWIQSLIGAVEEGSLFAWLQSIAMTGVPAVFKVIGGFVASLFGALVAAL
ncbi:hypothetical protein DENSPDRAFT_883364 [Dentipellis sp. KUC8613]|nr:hypothetical protein DENSPDRAFT_883364 [Dentipellis sp. KUC8613]